MAPSSAHSWTVVGTLTMLVAIFTSCEEKPIAPSEETRIGNAKTQGQDSPDNSLSGVKVPEQKTATGGSTSSFENEPLFNEFVSVKRQVMGVRNELEARIAQGEPAEELQLTFQERVNQIINDSEISVAEYKRLEQLLSENPGFAAQVQARFRKGGADE